MAEYFIGWDVGAWKCSAGRKNSCDAIVVICGQNIIGHYRANISRTLQDLATQPKENRIESFINKWFSLTCGDENSHRYDPKDQYFVAIDTPLGWPKDFKTLLDGKLPKDWTYDHSGSNIQNTLLFRYTEKQKLASGLSAIVNSIGSQSVKGLLLLEILNAKLESWGIWKAGNVVFLETYPKACLIRPKFMNWIQGLHLNHSLVNKFKTLISKNSTKYRDICVIPEDLFDAGVCACVAKAFSEGFPPLVTPSAEDPVKYKSEGWIFYPDESTNGISQSIANGHMKSTCAEGVLTFHDAVVEFQKHINTRSAAK
tara:strand:+ start:469 stop:1407 length:939 start_codon:yes stop_codon:yes gene_type:complete